MNTFRSRTMLFTMLGAALLAGPAPAQTTNGLARELEPFRPFLGKTWKGPFRRSTPEKPLHDVARWERALNGQAIRILHSLNDGQYGGESLIVWNRKTSRLEFFYFTTAGFYTRGTARFEDGRLVTHEEVTGSEDGIAEVKATTELLPDGRLRTRSTYLKKGEWVEGREVVYVETPGAEVRFK